MFAQPMHQPENPAPSALRHGYCDFAQHDGVGRPTVSPSPDRPSSFRLSRHSRSTRRPQTSSFRAQSRNPCLPSQCISQRIQRPLHSAMDTATSRSMTAWVGRRCPRPPTGPRHSVSPVIPEVPADPKLRHSARSRGIHVCPANASARESSALCTPPWILRLRAA